MTAGTSTKTTTETVVENDGKAGTALLAGLRKAAKAAGKATGKADRDAAAEEAIGYLKGAVGIYGDPKAAADAVLRADDLTREAAALTEQYGQSFAQWLKIAHESKAAGVTAKGWAAATGSSAMMLGRLSGAHDIVTASRANGTPVSPVEAYRIANRLQRNEVDAMVLAYVEAEEGVDPFAEGDTVAAASATRVPTVEAYLKSLERIGEALSTLLSGDFATPKAETLEAMEKAEQTLDRIAKQHATLTAKVRKAGKSPKAKAAA